MNTFIQIVPVGLGLCSLSVDPPIVVMVGEVENGPHDSRPGEGGPWCRQALCGSATVLTPVPFLESSLSSHVPLYLLLRASAACSLSYSLPHLAFLRLPFSPHPQPALVMDGCPLHPAALVGLLGTLWALPSLPCPTYCQSPSLPTVLRRQPRPRPLGSWVQLCMPWKCGPCALCLSCTTHCRLCPHCCPEAAPPRSSFCHDPASSLLALETQAMKPCPPVLLSLWPSWPLSLPLPTSAYEHCRRGLGLWLLLFSLSTLLSARAAPQTPGSCLGANSARCLGCPRDLPT